MSVPRSGMARLPILARIASGSSGAAVGADGSPARKSATLSTSQWPTSRNSSGDMSPGDERRLRGLAALATFFFADFLGVVFDFGKARIRVVVVTGEGISSNPASICEAFFVQ